MMKWSRSGMVTMSVKKEVQGDLSYNKIYVSLGEEG